MQPSPLEFYQNQIDEAKQNQYKIRRRLYLLSASRFISFVFAVLSPFLLIPINTIAGAALVFVSIIIFLFSLKRYSLLEYKSKYYNVLATINSNEILALNHNFSVFQNGSKFIDPVHPNSFDLDLFGEGSLFQFLNRTSTLAGERKLAFMLTNPLLQPKQIEQRQQAVDELAACIEWRQSFLTFGNIYLENSNETALFKSWHTQNFNFSMAKILPAILIVLPIASISALCFWIFAGNSTPFILATFFQAFIYYIYQKTCKSVYRQFGKRVNVLDKYSQLLTLIESKRWKSDELIEKTSSWKSSNKPSEQLKKLRKIISNYDAKNNLIVGIVLNTLVLWDLQCSYRLVKWHNKNRENYLEWEEIIAFYDALISVSNFCYNDPINTFPIAESGDFYFDAKKLAHPLINRQKRIGNNFNYERNLNVIIITGANMAGKSTFLRTIGVNMVLAMMGAPVCAAEMRFTPVEVFTNMRTTDSLSTDESYFFAELKRIKLILDELTSGRKMLIILDEILKGTNSTDKLIGSQKLVNRLIDEKATVIIATHDLKLTEIENEYPSHIANHCFEIDLNNDVMQFDYTLRKGVTKTMNASFLMRKMGIIKS